MSLGYDGNFTILEPVTTEVGGEKKTAVRNITRDQIAILMRSGTLSTQEGEAGRRLQILRERASIGGLKAQEFQRTFQDSDVVAGRDSHLPEQAAWAFWKLDGIRKRMGPVNWRIMVCVVFENMSREEMVRVFPRHRIASIGAHIAYAFEELTNVIDAE